MKALTPYPVDLPETGLVADELLLFLNGHDAPPQECYRAIAVALKLDWAQLSARRNTTEEPAWNNRVQTAREHLAKRGLVHRLPRHLWRLTDDGRAQAQKVQMLRSTSLSDL